MKPVLFGTIILVLSFFCSCQGDIYDDDITSLCIEGWIEADAPPVVIVSETLQLTDKKQPIEDGFAHFLHNARVTITANGQEYVLKECHDAAYPSQYIYTSDALVGQEGVTYRLEVTCKDYHAYSSTTIPSVVEADSIAVKREPGGQISLQAHLTDPADTHDWYKVFARTDTLGTMFISSFLGTKSDDGFPDHQVVIPIYRGRSENCEEYTPFFNVEEQIDVKLCHIDSVAYHYWSEFDKMLVLSRNPFLTYQANLPGNIQGALGYWFGYGSKVYHITTPNS